jgi:hypothetical protein
MASKRTRELDFRSSDGLEVALLWQPDTDGVSITVFDVKTGDGFDATSTRRRPWTRSTHPYAYAASRGVHFVLGTRTSTEVVPV